MQDQSLWSITDAEQDHHPTQGPCGKHTEVQQGAHLLPIAIWLPVDGRKAETGEQAPEHMACPLRNFQAVQVIFGSSKQVDLGAWERMA